MFSRALYPSNPGGEIRAEEAGIGSLVRQGANRRQAKNDRGGCIVRLLQKDAIPSHSLVERKPRLGTVPVGEFTNCCSYDRRELAGQNLQNGDLRVLQIGQPESTVLEQALAF